MLEKIDDPRQISQLKLSELEQLAKEVRRRIIEVTAKNGGHIAPSLGATDIAIALLRIFDPLENRIIWDVGHQSYAYKILTGRNKKFDTLRQLNGISGFNNIFESKYDAFGVGHSSTSISAALGIATAKEMNKENGRTIAVIGDGALTGGMAFEALNQAGHLQKNIIVVLNDNNMSISKNVGALQSYLANILVSRSYNVLKDRIWDFVNHFPPRIRRRIILSAQKFEENMINTLAPNIIFEDLGFKYIGPIDGHNIPGLVRIFRKAKENVSGPVFLHVVTKKGKGYAHAEHNAAKFHGLGPFEVKTGRAVKKKVESTDGIAAGNSVSPEHLTYSKVFGNTLCEIAEKNDKIVAITAAMTDGTGLTEFAGKFPKRFFDVGIAEQHAVTYAAGLAIQKIKPFVAVYSTFLQRGLDQLIHDVSLQKLPVVFCLDRAGLVGEDGATHHGVFDLSYLNFIPNLVVMAPANSKEFSLMLHFAAAYREGPVAIRYPRGEAKETKQKIQSIRLGRSEIAHNGKETAIIAIGKAFEDAEKLFEIIKNKIPKSDPFLINARFSKPLDTEMLDSLRGLKNIITIEDNSLIGGFGSSIRNFFSNEKVRVFSYGIPDNFVTHGKISELKKLIALTPEQIFDDVSKEVFQV